MVDRLFQIVYLLMEKPTTTAKELAELFEVSQRTIYRDIDKLTLAGIPVYTNQGKNGGISILPDYVLNRSVLTAEEKGKIMESLNALNEVSPPEDKNFPAKLRSFLGDSGQDWIEIEFSSWGNPVKDAAVFAQIKEAILKHNYMEIVYSGNQGGSVRRKIRPLKLCFKDQAWYLYAYCCLREDYRFFKLKRISEITVSDACFEPEVTGKVLPKLNAQYSASLPLVRVTLEISPEMAFRAYEELPDISVADDDRLLCSLEVTDIDWFLSYVLSYGSHMRIVKPPEIREKVRQEVERMRDSFPL